jgi:hypothetical protein
MCLADFQAVHSNAVAAFTEGIPCMKLYDLDMDLAMWDGLQVTAVISSKRSHLGFGAWTATRLIEPAKLLAGMSSAMRGQGIGRAAR